MLIRQRFRIGLIACVLGIGMLPAGTARAQTPAIDLSGSWCGHWEDCRSGHCGPLRAEFCKCDDCHYNVTFTGRFFKVFPFRYSVVLNVVGRDGDKLILSGSNNLGVLFGTFTYQAEATPTSFVANYSSCRYQGRFVLSRCCGH